MLEVKKLSVSKGNKLILNNICFKLNKGDKLHIKGSSGTGKSTLLKSILFFEDFEGEIFFKSTLIDYNNLDDYRKNFAYVGQTPLNFDKSVKLFLQMPFLFKHNKHINFNQNKVKQLFDKFKLDFSLLNSLYSNLSGGEKQRLNIIQSILLNKKILVLDEIASALDEKTANIIFESIITDDELSVIIVSHRLNSKNTKNLVLEK